LINRNCESADLMVWIHLRISFMTINFNPVRVVNRSLNDPGTKKYIWTRVNRIMSWSNAQLLVILIMFSKHERRQSKHDLWTTTRRHLSDYWRERWFPCFRTSKISDSANVCVGSG
jgi:hypothetical protein